LGAEESSIIGDRWIKLENIHTHRQITDAHLLALALRHEGCLATFDRGTLNLVPKDIEAGQAVQLISSL